MKKVLLPFLLVLFQAGFTVRVNAQQELPVRIQGLMEKGIGALERGEGPADIREALAAFMEAAVMEPNVAEVHYYLGKTYSLFTGGLSRSSQELKLYLQLNPTAPDREEVQAEIGRLDTLRQIKWESDRLGCEFARTKKGIFVSRVASNSEGARIGLKEGDQVLAVGNQPVSAQFTLTHFYHLLDNYPGDQFLIRIQRAKYPVMISWTKKAQTRFRGFQEMEEGDLEKILLSPGQTALVVFWYPWCQSCDSMETKIRDWARLYYEKILLVSARLDHYSLWADYYKIQEVPTTRLYKNGALVWELRGMAEQGLVTEKAPPASLPNIYGGRRSNPNITVSTPQEAEAYRKFLEEYLKKEQPATRRQ